MWGQILISFSLLFLVNCAATTTCNPDLTDPGCPGDRICDPTGICQLPCDTDSACTDPNTRCDTDLTSLNLCQNIPGPSSCPEGQIPLRLKESTSANDRLVCKKSCSAADLGNLCHSTNSSPFRFICQSSNTGSGAYCWGPTRQ